MDEAVLLQQFIYLVSLAEAATLTQYIQEFHWRRSFRESSSGSQSGSEHRESGFGDLDCGFATHISGIMAPKVYTSQHDEQKESQELEPLYHP